MRTRSQIQRLPAVPGTGLLQLNVATVKGNDFIVAYTCKLARVAGEAVQKGASYHLTEVD